MKTLFQMLLVCLVGALAAAGQTAVHLKTQAKSVDFSAASMTKPAKAGTIIPATCEVGEVFFKTNAIAGQNLYGCVATDSWSLLGDGGSGGGAVDSVFGRTGSVSAQSGDYSAIQVSSTPSGHIGSTNLQAALNELAAEKEPADADLTAIAGLACGDGQIPKRVSGVWSCAVDQTGGTGSLPATGGNAHKLLSNDGTDPDWRVVGLGLLIDSLQLAVDTAVVPTLGDLNTFRGTNTFTGELNAVGPVSAVDFTGSDSTRPVQSGSTPPGNCLAREELFLDTDDTVLLICNATGNGWVAAGSGTVSLSIVLGDGINTLPVGVAGYLEIPYACTISRWTALANQSGSVQIDVWNDTYSNFPPTDTDSITASAPISMSAQKGQSAALTGWNTAINADDILAFNVDSASTLKQVTVSLKCTR
jgi:hypothetical protein